MSRFKLTVALPILFAGLVLVGGPGCDNGPKVVPVSGTVTLDGKPVAFGSIRFIPDSGRTGFSTLDKDGKFNLMTDDRVGCPVGRHNVEVDSVEMITEYKNRRHAPKKYDSASTSGLTVEIDGPKEDLKIELKSDGRNYPAES
jgi:hypothetical protein